MAFDPNRPQTLRTRCLNLSIGRFMKILDQVLAKHTDRRRVIEEEAAAVVRKAIEALADSEFGDSAVFLCDTPATPQSLKRPEWAAGEGDDEGPEPVLRDD